MLQLFNRKRHSIRSISFSRQLTRFLEHLAQRSECRNTLLISDPQTSRVQLLQPLVKSACKKVIWISLQRVIDLNANNVGHFIYECKYERPYISRPSRTQQLENPRLLAKLKAEGKPSVEVPEEFKTKYARAKGSGTILIYRTERE